MRIPSIAPPEELSNACASWINGEIEAPSALPWLDEESSDALQAPCEDPSQGQGASPLEVPCMAADEEEDLDDFEDDFDEEDFDEDFDDDFEDEFEDEYNVEEEFGDDDLDEAEEDLPVQFGAFDDDEGEEGGGGEAENLEEPSEE